MKVPALSTARALVRRLQEHHWLEIAASIAFKFFLSAVPLLALVGYVLGQFVRRSGVDDVAGALAGLLPAGTEEILYSELSQMAGRHGAAAAAAAPLSLLGFLWLASGGVHHLMRVIEIAAGAKHRSFLKHRAIAIAWVALALLVAAATGFVLLQVEGRVHGADLMTPSAHADEPHPVVEAPAPGERWHAHAGWRAHRVAESDPRFAAGPPQYFAPSGTPSWTQRRALRALQLHHALWERVLAASIFFLVGLCGLAGFYRFAVEHPRRVRRRSWPGAWLAIVLWMVGSWAFGAYVTRMGQYSVYYGSLGAVAVTLLWLYLTAIALLVGAELNAQLEGV